MQNFCGEAWHKDPMSKCPNAATMLLRKNIVCKGRELSWLADEDIIVEWSLEVWQLGRVNNCRTGNRKNTQPSPDQTSTRPFISDHFKGPYRSWSDDHHICIWWSDDHIIWSTGPLVRWSADPTDRRSEMVRWSDGPMIRWSAAPVVK